MEEDIKKLQEQVNQLIHTVQILDAGVFMAVQSLDADGLLKPLPAKTLEEVKSLGVGQKILEYRKALDSLKGEDGERK